MHSTPRPSLSRSTAITTNALIDDQEARESACGCPCFVCTWRKLIGTLVARRPSACWERFRTAPPAPIETLIFSKAVAHRTFGRTFFFRSDIVFCCTARLRTRDRQSAKVSARTGESLLAMHPITWRGGPYRQTAVQLRHPQPVVGVGSFRSSPCWCGDARSRASSHASLRGSVVSQF